MNTSLTEQSALEQFANGLDCSQVVLAQFSEEMGMDADTARRIAAGFGGGMWRGDTCGCVTGALMAIGLKYGHSKPQDAETKALLLEKKTEFEKAFQKEYKSCICKNILGYNLSVPEELEQIQKENLLASLCPKVACYTCKLLEAML